MFDIGFGEILIIAVVALVVIGPQRLPETVRFIAQRIARLKRSVSSLVSEMEKEVGMDDIRRQIHNEDIMTQLKSPAEEINRVIDDLNTDNLGLKSTENDDSEVEDPASDDQPTNKKSS